MTGAVAFLAGVATCVAAVVLIVHRIIYLATADPCWTSCI